MSECPHGEPVRWNPYNGVVQCHACGLVFVPLTAAPGAEYAAAVNAAYPVVSPAEPCEHDWQPLGFTLADCGGLAPTDRCRKCGATRQPFATKDH